MRGVTDVCVCIGIMRAGCLLLGAVTSTASCAKADDIQARVDGWIRSAAQVRDVHVRFLAREARSVEEPVSRSSNVQPGTDVALQYEIDYLFARPNSESYVRSGEVMSDRGIKPYQSRRVVFRDASRELIYGGENSLRIYDQYAIRPPEPLHEPALEPLRSLLNLDDRGRRPLFNDCVFALVEEARQKINGVECLLAETPDNRGIRVWFEPGSASLIHKLELNLAVAQRSGYFECIYRYSPSDRDGALATGADLKPVVLPSEWQIISYTPKQKVRMWITCQIHSTEINTDPGPDAFELPIPPGAIVSDRRAAEPLFFIQNADGTQQPIPRSSLGPEAIIAMSSRVPGSRVENRAAGQALADRGAPRHLHWLLGVNLVVILFGVVYLVVIRGRRKPQGYGSKP